MGLGAAATDEWDLVVAGDGPAGLATAIAATRAGFVVAVVAPARGSDNPRPLETMHPLVAERLDTLDAGAALAAASRGGFTEMLRNGDTAALGAGAAVHVDRAVLDDGMAMIARAAGVAFIAGRVTATRPLDDRQIAELDDGRRLRADWVVDASGRHRGASKSKGHRLRRLGPALVARTGIATAEAVVAAAARFDSFPWGWIWRTGAPGLVSTWTAVHAANGPIPPAVADLIERSTAGSIRTVRATWTCAYPLGADGFLAVGDAAGTIDPAAGHGVLNAIESGIAAAETIRRCRADPPAAAVGIASYHQWLTRRIRAQATELETHYRTLGIDFGRSTGARRDRE